MKWTEVEEIASIRSGRHLHSSRVTKGGRNKERKKKGRKKERRKKGRKTGKERKKREKGREKIATNNENIRTFY